MSTGLSGQQEEYGDALESVPDACKTVEYGNVETIQMEARLEAMENSMALLQGRVEAQTMQIRTLQDILGRQIQQRLDQLENNCNANVGEAVAAGIEEIRDSALTAGKELSNMVEAAVKRCDSDMRALQGEHAKSDRALKLQLHAVLEQARDMRVWREQHNIRLLEMQAALTAMEKRSKNALARTERLCEASVDSVRRGAAASLAMEARRLEGLLSGHTTRFADDVHVPPFGTEQVMAAPNNEVEEFRLPSPPSEISYVQSSPQAPAHSPSVTWQQPWHAHSLESNSAQSRDSGEAAILQISRLAAEAFESKMLHPMSLGALELGHASDSRTLHGTGDISGVLVDTGGLKGAQHEDGESQDTQASPQKPAAGVQGPSATSLLTSIHAEDIKQHQAVLLADTNVSTAGGMGTPASHEREDELSACAEEVGPPQFWQSAIDDMELPSFVSKSTRAGALLEASADFQPADAISPECATDASTEHQVELPCPAGRASSEGQDVSTTTCASSQHAPAIALPETEAGPGSLHSEGPSLLMRLPSRCDLEASSDPINVQAHQSASAALARNSSPDQPVGFCAPSAARCYGTAYLAKGSKIAHTKPSRRRKTLPKPRALPMRGRHDADVLAALLALQMAVSDHSAAILQLKKASRPESCCSPPASPTQLMGLLCAYLDLDWSREGSQGVVSEFSSQNTTPAVPDSEGQADVWAPLEEGRQGLPHQPSTAAATDGSGVSNESVGNPSQADQMQLRHARKVVPRQTPSAAAGAGRRPPGTPLPSMTQAWPGMKQGAKRDAVSFTQVLQGWHKERRLRAGASKK